MGSRPMERKKNMHRIAFHSTKISGDSGSKSNGTGISGNSLTGELDATNIKQFYACPYVAIFNP